MSGVATTGFVIQGDGQAGGGAAQVRCGYAASMRNEVPDPMPPQPDPTPQPPGPITEPEPVPQPSPPLPAPGSPTPL